MKQEYSLRKDGVEMVEYSSEVRKTVNETARLWQRFCELPEEYKRLFATSDTQRGTGYEAKDGSGPRGDKKENFDYSVNGDNFSETLRKHFNDITTEFLALLGDLESELQGMITDFGARHSLPTEGAETFIRCLRYPQGEKPNGIIAEPHTDHSGFTFHLFETTDGCERLDFKGAWKRLPVADGQAAAFGGMQSQLASGGEIKALCHRVVANEISARAGRIAIVCFVSLTSLPVYDKETHGRLQEKKPGFNYDMPSEAFATLFKQNSK